ncbi:MAG: hypothetical protein PWP23_1937 [Candidatus Sumerlaeota bacterium]|nr:hypothetical protein [Candidatus Sumerlaeota bacterium]
MTEGRDARIRSVMHCAGGGLRVGMAVVACLALWLGTFAECPVSVLPPEYPTTLDHGPWPQTAQLTAQPWIGTLSLDDESRFVRVTFDCDAATTAVAVGTHGFAATTPLRLAGQRLLFDLTTPDGVALACMAERDERGMLAGTARHGNNVGAFELAPESAPGLLAEAEGAYEYGEREFVFLFAADTSSGRDVWHIAREHRVEPVFAAETNLLLPLTGSWYAAVRDYRGALAQLQTGFAPRLEFAAVRRNDQRTENVTIPLANGGTVRGRLLRPVLEYHTVPAVLVIAAPGTNPDALVERYTAELLARWGLMVLQTEAPAIGDGVSEAAAAFAWLQAHKISEDASVGVLARGAASAVAAKLVERADSVAFAILVSPMESADMEREAEARAWANAAAPVLAMFGERDATAGERAALMRTALGTGDAFESPVRIVAGADAALRTSPADDAFVMQFDSLALRGMEIWLADNLPPAAEEPELPDPLTDELKIIATDDEVKMKLLRREQKKK